MHRQSSKLSKVRYVPKAATDIRNLGGRCGSVAAAGESLLRVCFGEFIDDDRCKSESLELPSLYLENFSKGDTEIRIVGGSYLHDAVARYNNLKQPITV
jgi:hypothetical protein